MNILLQPDSLSLVGSMNDFEIYATADVAFVLQDVETGKNVVQHTYTPNENHRITLQLKDVILPLLSFKVSDSSDPYVQPLILKTYKATFTEVGTATPKSVSFSVLRAGVDRLSDSASNFLKTNFLTWQPNVKAVTYYSPEFLTYYAQEDCVVKCNMYFWNGVGYDEKEVTLATLNSGKVWTIPVQYAIIAKNSSNGDLPSYYDVWVESTGGTRFTYVQRYYASDMKSEEEEWFLFENSLGGIDCFRAYGNSENTAEHTHNVAEIEEDSEEYRVDTTRKFKKHTGYLDERERLWLLDFFPSLGKYHYSRQSLRQIVVTESDVNYEAKELPTDYSFTYKYADARPYLNLSRTDVQLTEMSIHVPDLGNFTIAPRLVEFSRLTLSGGALFPVQNPYSEEWGTTTFSAIYNQIVASMASSYTGGGGIGHTHANFDLLDALSYFGDYILYLGKKLNAGYADKAGELSEDSKVWQKFLRKDLISADHWEEILGKVRFLNDVEFAKGVTFKDVVKFLAGIESTDINNSGTIKTKNLEVTGLAHFFELVIDKIKSAGGAALFTPADGFDVDVVEKIDGGYRLLWRCQDGDGNQRDNMWRKDDQALCMSFNQAKVGEQHDVANKYYWALVTAVSDSAAPIEKDGEYYNYIEISSSDCDGTVNPEKGDSIVMLGYRGTDDKARQSAIYLSAYSSIDKGLTAPLFAQYRGINDFDLASHRTTYHDANGSKVVGQFEFESGESLESAKWYEITLDNDTASYDPVKDKFTPDSFGSLHVIRHIGSKANEEEFALVEDNLLGIIYHTDGSLDYSQGCEDGTIDSTIVGNGDKRDVSKVKFCFYDFDVVSLADDDDETFKELVNNNGNPDGIVPNGKLYCSKDFCIIRGGEKGDNGAPGEPGSNGKGFVAAYKYSNSTPSKPTATKNEANLGGGWYNTIPTAAPQWNGWAYDSSAPSLPNDYNWVKSPSIGDSERTYFECIFKTTSDNQEVNFKIQSSSESRYDFIYVSDVDASDVPSKPSSGSQKGDNYISGQNAEILTITKTIAKAGEHHVFVCYAKDGSNGYGDDCGWFTIENISFTASSPNILWQSNGVLDGETITSWTDPFRVTGEDGEKGKDGENGKGALEILINPQTVVFDTNDNGIVPTSTSKTAKISCYRDGVKLTNVSCGFNGALNCSGNVQDNGDGTSTVTISNISQEAIDSGTKVSVTSGYVEVSVWDKETGLYHYIHVPFQVNVSKYTGKMLADNKAFQTQYTEISNKYSTLPLKTDDELTKYTSSIKQTAREISLKVSEQAQGRRNMLYGSAFRKKDECPRIYLYGDYIGDTYTNGYYGDQGVYMNSGVDGANCLKVKCYYDGSNQQYAGIFYNCTSYEGLGNIKIEKGKKYTISVYVKGNTIGSYTCIEVAYKTARNSVNTEQVGNANVIDDNQYCQFTSDNVGKWVLQQITVDTSNAGDNEYLAVQIWLSHVKTNVLATAYFCRPMMEEGDTYNGWTLSEEDYDYVGGNLLDNTRILKEEGNLAVSQGTIVSSGFEPGVNVIHTDATTAGSYIDSLQWGTYQKPFDVSANTDYLLSFMAKGTGTIVAYFYRPTDGDAALFTEASDGYVYDRSSGWDGNKVFTLTSQWKRYWVHWRTKNIKTPQCILLRTAKGSDVYIAKPKFEIGCTMTDWTEKRTDMVDKQALLATGIDIANKKITATADNFEVRNNSGQTNMMVDSDGQLNTNLVRAKALTTLGSDGRYVNIEDGLISIFGTQGVANIRFGVDSDGRSILSYYDNDGTWKYDLGPNGCDASKMSGSTFEELQLVEQYNVVYTNEVFYSTWRTTINDKTYELYRVKQSYDSYIFGNRTRMDGLYPSNDPTKYKSAKKLYRYSAGKLNGNYVLDPSKGLSTLALVQAADGKVFTSNGTLAKDGSLVNLATGNYFKYGVKTSLGLNPYFKEDFDWPAARYTGYIQIVNGIVKNFDLNSYGTVTVNGGKLQ